MRAVFSLNDPAELEQLFRGAELGDVAVRRYLKTLRLPSPRDFLWQYVQCTPLAGQLADAGHELLAALEADVVERWRPWVTEDGTSYEQGMIVARGRRS